MTQRHGIIAELKCVPVYQVHIEHAGGVLASHSRDHEDVMWIGPGRMAQESGSFLDSVRKDSVGPDASYNLDGPLVKLQKRA